MTTVARVRQAVQPLLQRNPDLALVGRLVVVKPVHHILRGIYIDRSIATELFVPTSTVVFLFRPRIDITLHWGVRVYRRESGGPGVWDVADPQTSAMLCEEIEAQALPLLRPIKTADDFVAFTSKERFPDTYLDIGTEYPENLRRHRPWRPRGRAIDLREHGNRSREAEVPARYAGGVRSNNEGALSACCGKRSPWPRAASCIGVDEAQSVKNLKLEKLWEPTPFPVER